MSYIQESALAVQTAYFIPCARNKFFELACDYMLMHLSDKIHLDTICAVVGCNRNKLSMLFRERCGYSVMHWLREQRLKKAAELLRYSDMSVCFVAMESGFSDSANFCHAFKRKYHVSPRRYRRQPCGSDNK